MPDRDTDASAHLRLEIGRQRNGHGALRARHAQLAALVVRRTGWAFVLVGGAPIAIEIGRSNHHLLDWTLGLTTGGAYLLDTKRFVGSATFTGDAIHVERAHDADDQMDWTGVAKRVRGLAAELKRDRITFVHGKRLAQWLTQVEVVDPATDR